MQNVYLTLKRSAAIILLLFYQVAMAQPVIRAFTPIQGPAGTVVSITGTGFRPGFDSNFVYFGAVRATVLNASPDSIVVTVPKGATYAPVTVTTRGLTAYSRLPFTITYVSPIDFIDSSSFGPPIDLSGTSNGRSVAIADLNNDGRSDLFVTNQGTNNGAIFRNNSNNGMVSFQSPQYVSLGSGPFGVATGDLNGDGRLDVAAVNFNAGGVGTVTVLRNTSVGDSITFDTIMCVAGLGSRRVAIADINNDGKPDLVVTSGNSSIISIFRNTSPGYDITFAPKIDLTTTGHADEIAVADFDGDGKTDLASANFSAGISVWRNISVNDSILFTNKIDYTAGTNPNRIAIGDFNSDGRPDIAVSNYASATISIFSNYSSTGSLFFYPKRDFMTGANPTGLCIGDLSGNGKPDIAVITETPGVVSVLRNITSSDSINMATRVDYAVGDFPTDVAIGDLDGDGKIDQAVLYGFGNVAILKNNQSNIAPAINNFSPKSGQRGTRVTILGQYFTGATSVTFGGVPADSMVVLSDTIIQANVGTGATGNVTVTTPSGSASKPGFTFIGDTTTILDTPVILSFTPTSGKRGTMVTIFGQHFTNANAVRFGGVLADSITFKNDTVIVAIVDTGATGNVSVTTPFGTASKPGFTFIRDSIPDSTAAPVISFFTPTSARKGAKVLIFGSKFTNASAVRFGGVLADSITFKNDTIIIAIVGAGATGNVSVTTPFGTASKPGFTFIQDTIPDSTKAPVITSFNPTSARKGAKVLIFGSKFTNASAVRFGGVLADTLTFKNDSVIIAVVGAGATGSVSVTTPFGTASKPGFTFIRDTIPDSTKTPVITSFNPTSARKGAKVLIFGSRFTNASAVRFGGVLADTITFKNDSVIIAVVGAGATGNVSVTTPFGTASKPGFIFIQDSIPDTLMMYARKVTDNTPATDGSKPMALYPNPASGYVIWQHPAIDHATHLQLFDLTGRVVRNITVSSYASQTTIAINGLNTGVYKLVWNDGKNKVARTLLIK